MSHKKWLHAFVVFECPLGKTFREIALRVFVFTISKFVISRFERSMFGRDSIFLSFESIGNVV